MTDAIQKAIECLDIARKKLNSLITFGLTEDVDAALQSLREHKAKQADHTALIAKLRGMKEDLPKLPACVMDGDYEEFSRCVADYNKASFNREKIRYTNAKIDDIIKMLEGGDG